RGAVHQGLRRRRQGQDRQRP
ncbi:hypothetical protein CFC21_012138, partial [Triticum aestivum]